MRNFRFALRQLLKNPAFTIIVISTFALGIGANSAVFSVVNAVLLRPLPFARPAELAALLPYDLRLGPKGLDTASTSSYPDVRDWRFQNQVFERISVYTNQSVTTLSLGSQAIHVQGESVSANLFALLGIAPMLGRTFVEEEDRPGHRVIILSYELWRERFGADRNIVGTTAIFDGEKFEVVGVMPPRFAFPISSVPPEVWTTMSMLSESREGTPMTEQRGNYFLGCIARLKPGVSLDQAQANMDTISAALRQQYPDSNTNVNVKVLPFSRAMVADSRSALLMLCAMAGCVLLVACVNVVNLLLARAVSRQREISIRSALGAGRWQVVKQLLAESALLGVAGGTIGLVAAIWTVDSLKSFLPQIPRIGQVSPDLGVIAFTAFMSLAAAVIAGLLPAWRASHPNIAGALNESARGSSEAGHSHRTRAVLVVAEITLALMLLASAGLLIQSFVRLHNVNPGFNPTNIVTARVALPDASYPKPDQASEFFRKLLVDLSHSPGVDSAAAAWWIPLSGSEIVFNFDIQERPVPKPQQPLAQVNAVTPAYFKTLRVPLLRGREFTERDSKTAPPVAIVTESFAKQFFPGEDPLGKRIIPNGSIEPGDPPVREIVGIVGDMHLISLDAAPKPQIYVPHDQFGIGSVAVFVRSQLSSSAVMAALHNAVNRIDSGVPVYRMRTLPDYLSKSIAQPRLNAMLVGLFAVIALLLAAAGIFGVMSYSVTQRTQEIGIRFALGAQRKHVLGLVLGDGMKLVGIGLALGIVGIAVVGRVLQALLYGTAATDVPTIVGVSVLLVFVALIACWWPARRASGVDPIIALRAE